MRKGLTAVIVCALLVLLVPQAAWAGPPACPCTPAIHIVRWGENLWRISRWYGTTVEAIAQANGIVNPHCIYAGQRLTIPCTGTCPPPTSDCGYWYVIKWGDTLSGIAWKHGVSVNCLIRANGIVNPNRIYKGHKIFIPCDCTCGSCGKPCTGGGCAPVHGVYHTVRYGETLSGIAWRYGVRMWSIVQANGIANPNCIYAGQRLYIP
jgi:LysM repeat protein